MRPLFAVLLTGFVLRAAFFAKTGVVAQDDYLERALLMLNGAPMTLAQDLFRPPLYAWSLFAFFKVFGVHAAAAALLQCALGAGTGWMLYRMAKRLGDEKAGLAAAALWTVNIYSLYYSSRLMNETLYVALTVGFFWCWLCSGIPAPLGAGDPSAPNGRGWLFGALAGLLAGLSCLCKWTFMGYLPWFAAVAAIPILRKKADWKPLFACLAAAAFVIGLWGARNQQMYGKFILAGPQKGWNFYEGLVLQTAEDPERPAEMAREARSLGIDQDPFVQDDYFWKKGWDEVSGDPASAVLLFTGKALKFWRLAPYPPHPKAVRWAAGLFYLVLFACALQGALIARRRRLPLAPIAALFAYTWLLHTVMFSGIRYRFPLDPFLTLLAGFSLARLFWGDGREAATPPSA